MIRYLLLITLLAGCGKFEDEVYGPLEVPKEGDWRSYGTMADYEMLVDVKSITHDDDYAPTKYTYVWLQQKFNEDQTDEITKKKYRLKYSRHAIDCPSKKMAGVLSDLRDTENEQVARYDIPGFQWEFDEPPANSFGGDFVRQVCKIMAEKEAKAKLEEN
ncbi:MAG: hypothetical protein K2Q15_13060 [Burkholderiales bacterium]|jgi:hypothetical protein|nr:hypothetical protein [Burkholderiales bacterium]MCX7207876.1 hypothetical protein [Pseudomonadota bacterium]